MVTIAILYGTLSPSDQLPHVSIFGKDKLMHFLVFLAWTFLYGITHASIKKSRPKLWVVFTLGLFYGLLIEILQSVLPTNRDPEFLDLVADTMGSAVATFGLYWVFKLIPAQTSGD